MREIPQCFATGQAAGVAATLSIKNNLPVNSISNKDLRNILSDQGAYF